MTQETFRTRTDVARSIPVEDLAGTQLTTAAAIVTGNILSVSRHRGMGAPERFTVDPTIEQALDVVANFHDRHAAAVVRARNLGYAWPEAEQQWHEQVMTAFVAEIPDQTSPLATTDHELPAMMLEPRPDYVLQMGPDTESLYSADLQTTYSRVASEIAGMLVDRIPAAARTPEAVIDVAAELASQILRAREGGVQFGIDTAEIAHRQELMRLPLMGRENPGNGL